MNIIRKIPGPLLVFLGACSLSFGGLLVKSFEGATLWQILFWRSLFFSLTVLTFLIISYKKKTLKAFYESGVPGFIGGIILSFGFCGYVFAMYNTTVANTNFIISLQILFLTIIIKTAKVIGIVKAARFPDNSPGVKEFQTITKTPDIAKTIEIKVNKLIFSFKKKYPKIARNNI